MVVSNGDGDGTGDNGSLVDFAWRDNGIVGRADGDDGIGCHLMHCVQKHCDEMFAAIVGQNGTDKRGHVGC